MDNHTSTGFISFKCLDMGRVNDGYRDCADGTDEGKFDCGTNKRIDPGEACDDWNIVSGDGCSGVCEFEPGFRCFNDFSLVSVNGSSRTVCIRVPQTQLLIACSVSVCV